MDIREERGGIWAGGRDVMDDFSHHYTRFLERHWALILDMGILLMIGGAFLGQMYLSKELYPEWLMGILFGAAASLVLLVLPFVIMLLWMIPWSLYRLNRDWYKRNIGG